MRSVIMAVVLALVLGVVASGVQAGEKKDAKKPETTVIQGKTACEMKDGACVGNSVTTDDGTVYKVAGAKAKDLCPLNGKTVKVTGYVKEKDGVKTIMATKVEEVAAAAPAPAPAQ